MYEVEVEDFVRNRAHAWAMEQSDADRRLLLLVDEQGQLVAVGAHHIDKFYEEKPERPSRGVYFLAVATGHQGGRALNGDRISDMMLQAVIDDVLIRDSADVPITAIIHRDNTRSLKLFFRHGFRNLASYQGDYLIAW
ncbi:hypothetical protein AB6N24_15005 [Cellulomonas sp. 179-A 4D5 NHS]|uniref:hypothetical protein n=1 Tax=Cellulomonas sp. 179-A 4D5 NHS TaxID=3142378 RepID=UPI00399F4A49